MTGDDVRPDPGLPADLYHRDPCCPCPGCGGRGCYVLHGDKPGSRAHHFCVRCHGEWIVGLIRDAEAMERA